MFIILNGPLGIGKSTLADALAEQIDQCVMLDGDHLVAVNPPPADPVSFLHATIRLLVGHYRNHGYRHFVINHLWQTPQEMHALRETLHAVAPDAPIHPFLLHLALDANLDRIQRRQRARALDETSFEAVTVAEERGILYADPGDALGERFEVADPPEMLVQRMLERLQLGRSGQESEGETPQA